MSSVNYRGLANDGTDKSTQAFASPEPIFENTRQGNDHEGDFVTANERNDLARGLQQRHIGLIALAGAIVRCSPLRFPSSITRTL